MTLILMPCSILPSLAGSGYGLRDLLAHVSFSQLYLGNSASKDRGSDRTIYEDIRQFSLTTWMRGARRLKLVSC